MASKNIKILIVFLLAFTFGLFAGISGIGLSNFEFTSSDNLTSQQSLLGVYQPLPEVQTLNVPADWNLYNFYKVVLNREPDVEGFKNNLKQRDTLNTRQVFNAFLQSSEFYNNESLQDKRAYITRVYQNLLKRNPTETELNNVTNALKSSSGTGTESLTWFQYYNSVLNSPEFKNVHCTHRKYSYGSPLKQGSPTLTALFNNRAVITPPQNSENIKHNFRRADGVKAVWDQKTQIFYTDNSGYYALTRGFVGDNTKQVFNVFLMFSPDGINFQSLGPIFSRETPNQTFYDPYVLADSKGCIPVYRSVSECFTPGMENVSVCYSETSLPTKTYSWSEPKVILSGCDSNPSQGCISDRYISTSTPTLHQDKSGDNYFLSVTVVDDGVQTPIRADIQDDGSERTYTKIFNLNNNPTVNIGNVTSGRILLDANTTRVCDRRAANNQNARWDCNNVDVQSIYREGDNYFALYNGANYFRCTRPSGVNSSSEWGIGIARSNRAGNGFEKSSAKLVSAERFDTCAVSYPVINAINGELYLYYAFIDKAGNQLQKRSKITF